MGSRAKKGKAAIHSDPEILSGIPVFAGTRVPFQSLIDYIEAGRPTLDSFGQFSDRPASI